MLVLFICTFALLAVLLTAMAVGVLFGREPIKGSCGGMKALSMGTACEICGNDPNKCEEVSSQQFYDATQTSKPSS